MVVVKLLLVILVLLVLINRKLNLGLAILAATALLLLLYGRTPVAFVQAAGVTLRDPLTWTMVLTILFIGVLGHVMNTYGLLEAMIRHLEQVVRSTKLTIILAPTLIGLMLVSGGALMSCPIVDTLGQRLNLPNDRRAVINMIYRHGLYFSYPLSSTMILAAQLGGFESFELIRLQFPVTLAMYTLGYLLFLRGVPDVRPEAVTARQWLGHLLRFGKYAMPIWLSIALSVALGLPFYATVPFGIVCAVVIHLWDSRGQKTGWRGPVTTVLKGVNIKLALTIMAILLFKNAIVSIGEITDTIVAASAAGVPMELIILLTCMLVNFPTGNFQPALAIAFPLVTSVVGSRGELMLFSYMIYTISFLSYYTSPLHMCQVLTVDYFGITTGALFKNYRVFFPLLLVFLVGWYFVLRVVLL